MTTQLETAIRSRSQGEFRTWEEKIETGRKLREKVPRTSQAHFSPSADRRDPIEILEESNQGRLSALIPLRYGRMLRSPFCFMRGSASIMAYDLALTPSTGVWLQACGDSHLLNFGLFATVERNLVFDLNDFDETLLAPWEWDIKRLAASFVVAGRDNNFTDEDSVAAAINCVYYYRTNLYKYSLMDPRQLWYDRLDMQRLIDLAEDDKSRKFREKIAEKARQKVVENLFPKIVKKVNGIHHFVDQPPSIIHLEQPHWQEIIGDTLEEYRRSLREDRRVLLDRYRLEDVAMKVVGIGSVGTRCYMGLFFSEDHHPLILQFKEARPSVLEPYTEKCKYNNQGERVVVGQRLMQSSSDIFLGWLRGKHQHDFYVRQLRDMKYAFPVENFTTLQLKRYAALCGWSLARAHAKSGDAATISGYLGKSDKIDLALGEFALAYANQVKSDHAALVAAIHTGRIKALTQENS